MSGWGETVHLAVQKMKEINWSQSVPPSPGKHQIILLSLTFYCIAQIWRATYFTSFDLKQSDVGHKKGSCEIRKRTFCQTCENERREEINLADTFTSRPCIYSHIDWRACLKSYSERVMIFTFLTFDVLSSRFSSFRFQISMLSSTCVDPGTTCDQITQLGLESFVLCFRVSKTFFVSRTPLT